MPKVTKPKKKAANQRKAVVTQQKIAGILPGVVTLGDVAGVRAAKARARRRKAKNSVR